MHNEQMYLRLGFAWYDHHLTPVAPGRRRAKVLSLLKLFSFHAVHFVFEMLPLVRGSR